MSWTGLAPSASMTQISSSPSGLTVPNLALDSNAICVPSGDHAGAESNAPGTSNRVAQVAAVGGHRLDRAVGVAGSATSRTRTGSGSRRARSLGRTDGPAGRSSSAWFLPSVSIVHRLETPGALRRNSRRLRSGHQVGWLEASPSGRDREPRVVLAGCRHPRDLEVRGLAGLADAVRDIASVGRPVRLRVVLGVGGQLPQVRRRRG